MKTTASLSRDAVLPRTAQRLLGAKAAGGTQVCILQGSGERVFDRIRGAYAAGRTEYGELGFSEEVHGAHVYSICARHVRPAAPLLEWLRFVDALHGPDLYLAFGCSAGSAAAWSAFARQFRDYLVRLAERNTSGEEAAQDLAEAVILGIFLPDRRGRSRIASYDGRSSLATWLRALVCHRAINERRRNDRVKSVADLLHATPGDADERVYLELLRRRYAAPFCEALRQACSGLSCEDRTLLILRYDGALRIHEIAHRLALHPSNVSRRIARVCRNLRSLVEATLERQFHLSPMAVEECLRELAENPPESILALLKRAEPASAEPADGEQT